MSDTIGIHIRAKANLDEVDAAARKLEKFGGASTRVSSKVRQLVESLKESAGTDVNNLVREIDKLQKKIQEPGLTAKERKQAKGEINDIKAKIKELKQLQKVKADDYGSMEQSTRMYLDQLKNKKALTRAEKEHIKEIEKGLSYTEKYNKAKLDLGGAHLDKIQQDLKEQDEAAKKAGLGGAGQYVSRFGKKAVGLVIGGTIVGVAVQAMKKWAEVDTQIVKTSASLDDMSKAGVEGLMSIGKEFGYTKAQSLAFIETLTAISGKMGKVYEEEAIGMNMFLNWGRAMGVGGAGLQMRELQRWGGEGVKPGTDKYFLTQFTAMARMMNMREGRMTEFIETAVNMTKVMERTFIKIEDKDILRNILIPGMVFGGADRGRGQRGLSYMQRLNEGITGGGDLMNLMMYNAIGVPGSFKQMVEYGKILEQGAFGMVEGEPLALKLFNTAMGMFGGKYRSMAMMKAAMPGMSWVEIEEFSKMQEGLKEGTRLAKIKKELKRTDLTATDRAILEKEMASLKPWRMEVGKLKKETIEKLGKKGIEYEEYTESGEKKGRFINIGEEDFKALLKFPEIVEEWKGKGKVSKGEEWKVAIENMQVSVGKYGELVIPLLTTAADGISSIMKDVNAILGLQEKPVPVIDIIDKNLGFLANPLFPKKEFEEKYKSRELEEFKTMVLNRSYHDYISSSGKYQYRTSKSGAADYLIKQGMTEKEAFGYLKDLEKSLKDNAGGIQERKQFDLGDQSKIVNDRSSFLGQYYGYYSKDTDKTEVKDRDMEKALKKDISKYREKVEDKSYLGGTVDHYKILGKISDLDINKSIPDMGNVKEIRTGRIVVENPLDMGNPTGTTIVNNYHVNVDGGDIWDLKRDPKTGMPDFKPLFGPVDNE